MTIGDSYRKILNGREESALQVTASVAQEQFERSQIGAAAPANKAENKFVGNEAGFSSVAASRGTMGNNNGMQ